jgi:hypothetical protein
MESDQVVAVVWSENLSTIYGANAGKDQPARHKKLTPLSLISPAYNRL